MVFPVQSIRYRFMLLIVLVAFPIAVYDVYYETVEKQRSTIKVTEDLQRSTDSVVGKFDDLIETSHELLTGLAAAEEVKGGNLVACSRLLHDVGRRYRKYTNFSVVNADKYIVCSSGPLPKPIHVAHSPNINAAFATGAFAVSPFKFGVLTGKPILVFSEPILDRDKQVVGTINNGLSLAWLGGYLTSVVKLEGEHIVVFDDQGTTLASYPDGSYPVGGVVDANISRLANQGVNGTGTFTLASGRDIIAAHATIPRIPGGAHVISFTSLDALQSDIMTNLYQRLLIIGSLMAISLFLVWVGAKALLLNPISRLVATSEALANGDLKVRSDFANEANELGRLGLLSIRWP